MKQTVAVTVASCAAAALSGSSSCLYSWIPGPYSFRARVGGNCLVRISTQGNVFVHCCAPVTENRVFSIHGRVAVKKE